MHRYFRRRHAAALLSTTRRVLIAAGAVAAASMFAACAGEADASSAHPGPGADGGAPPPATDRTPVRVRAAAAVDRAATVRASGTVDANATADVAFQVSGKVARVAVEEGDLVRAGQLLAAIDTIDYQLAAEQAAVNASRADDELARMRALHERGSIAPNDYQKFEASAKVARMQAELARKRLGDTRLVAPIAGVVARRGVDPGETAAAGAPAFTVVAIDPVTVRVGIPEAQVGRIRPGAAAEVEVAAMGGRRLAGRVTMVGVSADAASRTYPVKITVPNRDRALLPGMIAEAQIAGGGTTRALTLPGESIVRDAEGATLVYVYFPDERRVYARRVTVGAPAGREIEILGGIEPQELVVIAGQQRLRDGKDVSATVEALTPSREGRP